ncbi:MAG TPA: hypothetical protein PLA94_19560 [Myxococcota bacterium]|nr:hypothetical protein [Myxococcota bacterium]
MTARPIENRYIAAVRFVDPCTGLTISDGLEVVEEGGCRWFPNRSGLWVLAEEPRLTALTESFLAPPASTPAARAFTLDVTVRSRTGAWQSRRFSLAIPRPPKSRTDDLFKPLVVPMPPGPLAPTRPGWGMARVRVRLAPNATFPEGTPLEGVLVRSGAPGISSINSLTSALGEALLPVPGIPLFRAGDGSAAVLEADTPLRIQIVYERAATDLATGRRLRLPDPDDLWNRRNALVSPSQRLPLRVGEQKSILFDLPRS